MGSFRPDPNILKKHPNAITQQQIDEKSRFLGTLLGAAAGQSDVERMLVLLRSILACGRLDLEDVARGYLKWFAGKPEDIDDLTRAALENLRAGDPPSQSGAIAWEDAGRRSAGNGSVTCCPPVGLLHVKRLDGLADDAAAASRITHYDPRCVAGCVAVATAIAHLVRGGRDAEEAVDRAASAAGTISDEVRAVVERAGARKPADLQLDGPDPAFVSHAVELAFSALSSATDFENGMVALVSRSGEPRTNACVGGALLGARFGKSGISDRWLSRVGAVPELISLGEQLYRQL